ncbi:MAG: MaoC family dehydratase [Deltaproteobacteria bacterium]|nr:MaoC family dehydratase [Deltaproteobacteria bacterium]
MVEIGQSASICKTIESEDILDFARLVCDENPLHLDEEFSRQRRFGRPVAHGMFAASLISAVLGTRLPGPGTIYVNQTLSFLAPAYVGDTLTATATVIKKHPTKPVATLETVCTNQNGEVLIRGEAVVFFDARACALAA